jgi:hypothetical protein
MKRTPFYTLKRPLQERFLAATRGQTIPAPLAFRGPKARVPLSWAGASVAATVLLCVSLTVGYGDLDHSFAIAPSWVYTFYGALLAIALWTAVQAWAVYQRQRVSPFEIGAYLFPVVLIDAQPGFLDCHPLQEGGQVTASGRTLTVRTTSRTWQFDFPTNEEAQGAADSVTQALLECGQPSAEWHRFDPMAEPRYSSPFTSRDRLEPFKPIWLRWSPVIAVAIAAIVAPILGGTRNLLSERSLYLKAVAQDTPETYKSYLQRAGGKKRPDVADVRLPTAELNRLKDAHDTKALEEWAIAQGESPIKPTIDFVVRQALLHELVEVSRKESLGAVREFVSAHPKHELVAAEVRNLRKRLTKRLTQDFIANHASTKTEGVDATVSALLDYLSEHEHTVDVRFQRILDARVARADNVVTNSKYFAPSMLPSQYFDATRSRVREDGLYKTFEQRFRQAFTDDVVELKRGEPIDPGQKPPDSPERPLLLISHNTTMGHGIGSKHPNGIFVGVGFNFEASLTVPGDVKPLKLNYSTWRMPDLVKLREGKVTIAQVYENMADFAFDAFEKRLSEWLIRPVK